MHNPLEKFKRLFCCDIKRVCPNKIVFSRKVISIINIIRIPLHRNIISYIHTHRMIFLSGWWWWHDRSACKTLGGISNHCIIILLRTKENSLGYNKWYGNHIYKITFMVHFKNFKRRITKNLQQHQQQYILTWKDLSEFQTKYSFLWILNEMVITRTVRTPRQ